MSQTPQNHSEILGMSDEEFLNTSPTDFVTEGSSEGGESVVPPVEETPPVIEEPPAETPPVEVPSQPDETPPAQEQETPPVETPSESGEQPPKEETPPAQPAQPAVDYAAIGKRLLESFTANGKTIEIRNEEEARALMQMGANYTKKMQAIAPHRKLLMMLEKNGLLDESRVSFLIDVEKKNPEAIRKLLKDGGIDPMDIDTTKETTYQEGNHRVGDDEAAFRSALEDLQSTSGGQETIQLIHTSWDQASKEVLWQTPDILRNIQQQRESGVYDKIATEVERQKTLGVIPPDMPFLHAYKQVGDEMVALAQRQVTATQTPPAPTPVATTVQKPKATVANGKQVSAATPSRSTPQKAEPIINPLSMSDEDFEKFMAKKM